MARFLKDKEVSNLTIDAEALSQLVDVLTKQALSMPEYKEPAEGEQLDVLLSFTIATFCLGNTCKSFYISTFV